jgi:hypothetical protein
VTREHYTASVVTQLQWFDEVNGIASFYQPMPTIFVMELEMFHQENEVLKT